MLKILRCNISTFIFILLGLQTVSNCADNVGWYQLDNVAGNDNIFQEKVFVNINDTTGNPTKLGGIDSVVFVTKRAVDNQEGEYRAIPAYFDKNDCGYVKVPFQGDTVLFVLYTQWSDIHAEAILPDGIEANNTNYGKKHFRVVLTNFGTRLRRGDWADTTDDPITAQRFRVDIDQSAFDQERGILFAYTVVPPAPSVRPDNRFDDNVLKDECVGSYIVAVNARELIAAALAAWENNDSAEIVNGSTHGQVDSSENYWVYLCNLPYQMQSPMEEPATSEMIITNNKTGNKDTVSYVSGNWFGSDPYGWGMAYDHINKYLYAATMDCNGYLNTGDRNTLIPCDKCYPFSRQSRNYIFRIGVDKEIDFKKNSYLEYEKNNLVINAYYEPRRVVDVETRASGDNKNKNVAIAHLAINKWNTRILSCYNELGGIKNMILDWTEEIPEEFSEEKPSPLVLFDFTRNTDSVIIRHLNTAEQNSPEFPDRVFEHASFVDTNLIMAGRAYRVKAGDNPKGHLSLLSFKEGVEDAYSTNYTFSIKRDEGLKWYQYLLWWNGLRVETTKTDILNANVQAYDLYNFNKCCVEGAVQLPAYGAGVFWHFTMSPDGRFIVADLDNLCFSTDSTCDDKGKKTTYAWFGNEVVLIFMKNGNFYASIVADSLRRGLDDTLHTHPFFVDEKTFVFISKKGCNKGYGNELLICKIPQEILEFKPESITSYILKSNGISKMNCYIAE
jgi:hypothetical protein